MAIGTTPIFDVSPTLNVGVGTTASDYNGTHKIVTIAQDYASNMPYVTQGISNMVLPLDLDDLDTMHLSDVTGCNSTVKASYPVGNTGKTYSTAYIKDVVDFRWDDIHSTQMYVPLTVLNMNGIDTSLPFSARFLEHRLYYGNDETDAVDVPLTAAAVNLAIASGFMYVYSTFEYRLDLKEYGFDSDTMNLIGTPVFANGFNTMLDTDYVLTGYGSINYMPKRAVSASDYSTSWSTWASWDTGRIGTLSKWLGDRPPTSGLTNYTNVYNSVYGTSITGSVTTRYQEYEMRDMSGVEVTASMIYPWNLDERVSVIDSAYTAGYSIANIVSYLNAEQCYACHMFNYTWREK